MEPVNGGQRRVERCQSGHSNPPPPIPERIKARPAHILSVTFNPSGVQAFALLYCESFHSGSRKKNKKIIYLDGNERPLPKRTSLWQLDSLCRLCLTF